MSIRWTVERSVEVSAENIAEIFAAMDDDEQAQFFVAVARQFGQWDPGKGDSQLHYIAGHMRTCDCATAEARTLIRTLAEYLGPEQP